MEKGKWTECENACGICKGEKVVPGYNDLATTLPEMIANWSSDNHQKPEEVSRQIE